jgi:hypothetical protein
MGSGKDGRPGGPSSGSCGGHGPREAREGSDVDGRWKLEIWLDADLQALQVNTVLVDAYGKLLELMVVPLEPTSEVSQLVADLLKRLRRHPVEQSLFDGSPWAPTSPRT